MGDTEACCGFGGTFCVKFPDISNSMVERKTADIAATGAGHLLAGDLGCLMNIAGKLQRQGSTIKVRHVAEVLAGMTDEPGDRGGVSQPMLQSDLQRFRCKIDRSDGRCSASGSARHSPDPFDPEPQTRPRRRCRNSRLCATTRGI